MHLHINPFPINEMYTFKRITFFGKFRGVKKKVMNSIFFFLNLCFTKLNYLRILKKLHLGQQLIRFI